MSYQSPNPIAKSLTAPIVRILMRYISGALVAWGIVGADGMTAIGSNGDLQALLTIIVGTVLGAATEAFYGRAIATGGAR